VNRPYRPALIGIAVLAAAIALGRFAARDIDVAPDSEGNPARAQIEDPIPEEPGAAPSPAATDRASDDSGGIHEGEYPELSAEELAELPPDGGPHYNRLIFEQSPYLLIHADNPVDWYPWGDEAFEKARREDKPILLSVGYSTCHWCHVMERPDIDSIYMDVTQAIVGRAGWPNTVFLTPDRDPFFAGTYFPKEGRFNRPGMMDLLPRLASVWEDRREDVIASARNVTDIVRQRAAAPPGSTPDENSLDEGYRQLSARFDAEYGGFGTAPKFP